VAKYLRSDRDELEGIDKPLRPHPSANELSSCLIEELNQVLGGKVARAHDALTLIVGAVCRVSGVGHIEVIPRAA
jgi:hypothetical protein